VKAFITATGTDVGKTYVTCGLLRALRAEGRPTLALKPVLSGFDPADAAASDPALLLAAQGLAPTPDAIAAIAPWRFAAPLSPDWAAADEGRRIDYAAVRDFCRAAIATPGAVLIEGIGGVMVPLDARRTVLDLMGDLALPVVLVAASSLGTLSHTLCALAVLRARGLQPVVVVSASAAGLDLARTAGAIQAQSGAPTFSMPRADRPQAAVFTRILRAIEA
jgi:dethiobiotin synthetase